MDTDRATFTVVLGPAVCASRSMITAQTTEEMAPVMPDRRTMARLTQEPWRAVPNPMFGGVPVQETKLLPPDELVYTHGMSTGGRLMLGARGYPGVATMRFAMILHLHGLVTDAKRRLFGDEPTFTL